MALSFSALFTSANDQSSLKKRKLLPLTLSPTRLSPPSINSPPSPGFRSFGNHPPQERDYFSSRRSQAESRKRRRQKRAWQIAAGALVAVFTAGFLLDYLFFDGGRESLWNVRKGKGSLLVTRDFQEQADQLPTVLVCLRQMVICAA